VILVHRLLKNSVAQRHGLHGYALLTSACGALAGDGFTAHTESYEDVGDVECALLDLGARWRAQAEDEQEAVSREQARFLFEAELASPPEAVWSALTDPAHGMRWRVGVDDIRERHEGAGRGVGTVTHCVHGRTTIEQEIVDWRPPHHVSFRERNPIGQCLWTMSLAPLPERAATHLEWRIALRGGRRQALIARIASGRVQRLLEANFNSLLEYLRPAQPGEA
jgi:uncharacterized protein YndB with AHSA1/START domain